MVAVAIAVVVVHVVRLVLLVAAEENKEHII